MTTFTFKSIDVPAATGTYSYIGVVGVDNAGEAVGYYGYDDGDGDGYFHGFTAEGSIGIPYDPPGSTNTDIVGISANGEIFGDYTDNENRQHAFVDNSGVVTTVDIILASSTTISGINADGVIFGSFASAGSVHGFIDDNGTYSGVDVPGALGTSVAGVNAAGEIVGSYSDMNFYSHGFIIDNGVTTTIDAPGAYTTSAVGISAAGTVVGSYSDPSSHQHGFIDSNGVVTAFDIAGSTQTGINAINDSGEIVGEYADGAGNVHGFIDNNGIIATVDIPGSEDTDILGVNAAGDIFGYYNNASGQHGFVDHAVRVPTVNVSSDNSATPGLVINLSSLIAIVDPDNVGYQKLELWDSFGTSGGGRFVVNGVTQTGGHAIDVSPADISNVVFDAGTLGGTDILWAQVIQNDGTPGGWQRFSVTVPNPTVAVHNDSAVTGGQPIALSSLLTIADPSGVGYQKLELWDSDGTVGGGQFFVGGVAQTGGHAIDVTPANVATTVFDAGTLGGTDILWARLQSNDGSLSVWEQFSVTVPTPTLGVTSDSSAMAGQTINLSSLVTIADPGGTSYQKLELWDSDGTVGGGEFVVNGVAQTGGHAIDVSPGNVVNTVFDAGTAGGTDVLWAELQLNDGTVTGWEQFSVSVPTPILSVTSAANATAGQPINVSSLVTIMDPGGTSYQKLKLWDSDGTVGGGEFVVNGLAQTGGHAIDVSPGNVANTVFDAGTAGGTDILWAQLQLNDGTVTGWEQFSVSVPTPILSVTSAANATAGQPINVSSLVTIMDPGGTSYQRLELWDSNGTVGGGEFVVNGVAQTGGHAIDVSPGNVANTVFDAGTAGGTDILWAQLQLDDGSLSGWKQFYVTVPTPTLSVTNASAMAGQMINVSNLVKIMDPGGTGYQKLELWDSDGTTAGGEFAVNGVAQTAHHEIDVSPGSVANTVFDAGTAGGTDILWAQLQLNDGSVTGWEQFSVTVPTPILSVSNDATATVGQVIDVSSLVTIMDPGGTGYQKLELWDSNGTVVGGDFAVNGVAQTAHHEIDVTPGNVANTVFDAGTAGGTDILWAQLQLNDGTETGWRQFAVTVPPPTLSVSNFMTATPGQVINLSSLVTVSDLDNFGYQKLELWDSSGVPSTGQFVVNGVAQTGNHEIDVSPANVANTVFDEGTTGNTDILWARLQQNDDSVTAWQQFQVVDPVTVGEGNTLELPSAYAGHAIFAGSSGTLQLDDSAGFSGTVAGMAGQDTLDLRDINFATSSSPTYSGGSSGGTLSVTDGTHIASIALLGNMASSFVASSDGHGGTALIDQLANQSSLLALPVGSSQQHA